MCCSMERAHFEQTIVFIGEKQHPVHGLVHVLGYQNTAVNLSEIPNAMLLHIPAGEVMLEENFIDMSGCRQALRDMVRVLEPPRPDFRGNPDRMLIGAKAEPPAVRVFEHDIYTVVLSERPSLIPGALARVPEDKRPNANPPLFDFYEREFPGWTVAVCCFNNREARQAAPLMMWYRPMNEVELHWPTLDSHSGGVPDIRGNVSVDHWLITGSDNFEGGKGVAVDYSGGCGSDPRSFLPTRVIGTRINRNMSNGDFVIDTEAVAKGNIGAMVRQPVPSLVTA